MKYINIFFFIVVLVASLLKLNNVEGSNMILKIGIYGIIITQSIQITLLNKRLKSLEEQE